MKTSWSASDIQPISVASLALKMSCALIFPAENITLLLMVLYIKCIKNTSLLLYYDNLYPMCIPDNINQCRAVRSIHSLQPVNNTKEEGNE